VYSNAEKSFIREKIGKVETPGIMKNAPGLADAVLTAFPDIYSKLLVVSNLNLSGYTQY
jgi:hypothetical protein